MKGSVRFLVLGAQTADSAEPATALGNVCVGKGGRGMERAKSQKFIKDC